MNLREYEQAKFALAELLRSAATLTQAEKHEEREEQFQDLFVRLAEDRFNLVLIGRFNRGKSSLMNALLGTDRLPTGIVPLTSVVTTVTYGSHEKVTLKYRQKHLDIEIAMEDLSRYITQQGNPGNTLGIAVASIELPAEILRRGFYLVDTPGLGSVIAENATTTEAFLPQADAVILVTSYESPLSDEEFRLFQAAISPGVQAFVVINKQDLVSKDERREVGDFVRDRLQGLFDGSTPQIISVSARDGLAAKLLHDPSLLAESGIQDLETKLASFLLERKRGDFLVRMCERVHSLLQSFLPLTGIADLLNQLDELAGKKFSYRGTRPIHRNSPLGGGEAPFNLRRLRSCEICAEVDDALWEFLRRYQYELVAAPRERVQFAKHFGFCPFHTWEYQSIASPYGTCVGFPPLLDRLAKRLRSVAISPPSNLEGDAAAALPAHDDCVLCAVRDKAEAQAIARLTDRLQRAPAETLGDLSAVCLPHFAMLSDAIESPTVLQSLGAHHAALLERLSEDMRSYALKRNAVRRYLATKEEETVAKRAILLLAGYRNVNFASEITELRLKKRETKPARRRMVVEAHGKQPQG